MRIEDYGVIGDTQTAALVGRDGSIDWLCLPRFDSRACFCGLLGTDDHGCWRIGPADGSLARERRYRDGSLILESDFETSEGAVRLVDFMPPRHRDPDVVRIVQGLRGRVRMKMKLSIRLDYGSFTPWIRRHDTRLEAIAGPDALSLRTPLHIENALPEMECEFEINEGDCLPFVLVWHPSHERPPDPPDPVQALKETEKWWRDWSAKCTTDCEWDEAVRRSLLTLKALTYAPTGGIVAAATTSLPEKIGGVRNWDYRYCWLRDATFTLYALIQNGYTEEAQAWRDWLLRVVAGSPEQINLMYAVDGNRRLPEIELGWLPGYENSSPVRIGNAAYQQFQLDVFGEVMDAMHEAHRAGIEPEPAAWNLQRALMDFLEDHWREPDDGIWEVRGPKRHFTHSKMMAWVAFDRAVRAIDDFGLEGPREKWVRLRDEIHREVCERGYRPDRGAFTQYYDSEKLDASLLMMPLVGFLPIDDPRVRGTIEAIERELSVDGFVRRYSPDRCEDVDGLPPGEGTFLPCSFWLADALHMMGRKKDARRLFERLLSLRNDLGLLSEEYDPRANRLLGNFPQAFTHVALINTARNLSGSDGPAEDRRSECEAERKRHEKAAAR